MPEGDANNEYKVNNSIEVDDEKRLSEAILIDANLIKNSYKVKLINLPRKCHARNFSEIMR